VRAVRGRHVLQPGLRPRHHHAAGPDDHVPQLQDGDAAVADAAADRYDHLSDEPAKPVDGKAAGWVQDLQVRDGGQTMWCLPKWTRRAAELIANGEYRFVSPYFLVDYLDKASGQRIGPTLKAVAITNRPFLEGMETDPGAADVGWKRDATNTPQLQWMPARRQMSHFYWRPLPLFDQLRLLCPPCTPLIEPLERWAYLHPTAAAWAHLGGYVLATLLIGVVGGIIVDVIDPSVSEQIRRRLKVFKRTRRR